MCFSYVLVLLALFFLYLHSYIPNRLHSRTDANYVLLIFFFKFSGTSFLFLPCFFVLFSEDWHPLVLVG